jgi:ferric-dicitrate binding protein FerR (iron transport regulator)
MNKTERPTPPLSDERVEQLWRSSAPRILVKERRARARRQLAAAMALVLTGAGAGLGWHLTQRPPATPPLAEGEAAQGPRTVRLADQSTIELEPDALVHLDTVASDEVNVSLHRGRARFKVAKNRQRSFRVLAGATEVRVLGTTFTVESASDEVRVSVEEGTVEVRHAGELRRLTRGNAWRTPAPSAAPSAPTQAVGLDAMDAPSTAPARPEASSRPDSRHAAPGRPTKRGGTRSSASSASPTPTPAPGASTSGSGLTPAPATASAEALFRAAVDARRESGPRAAAQAWSTFLDAFPGDSRAGLAAFELGRIEMDVSHDTSGALWALERALSLSPSAAFAEDAMARMVQLRDQRHEAAACKAARARYLSRYPQGTYATSLASLCGP